MSPSRFSGIKAHRPGVHWRKAPFVLRHHPSVLIAAFVASLLVALAAAAEPFVTTAAASSALKTKLAELNPYVTGVEIRESSSVPSGSAVSALRHDDARVNIVNRRLSALPFVGGVDEGILVPPLDGGPPLNAVRGSHTTQVRLVTRPGALGHVTVLAQTSGAGVWIPDIAATPLRLRPGDTFQLTASSYQGELHVALRVKGIYRALAFQPERPYWGNFYSDIYPQSLDAGTPPPFIFVGRAELFQLAKRLGGEPMDEVFEAPVDPHGITLPDAVRLVAKLGPLRRSLRPHGSSLSLALGCVAYPEMANSCQLYSSLQPAVILARNNVSAISPAITLLSDAGIGIALAVAAAAGIFLVRRRRAEAALLFARGESAATFATRTATEVFGPTVLGGCVGFGIALGLTGVFAPTGSTDNGTLESAVAHAAIAVVVGLALLAFTATSAFLRLFDTGSRPRPWVRFLSWELPLLAVAFWLLYRVRSGGGLAESGTSGTHHPTLAVFVFPLLLVAAVAGLAARLVRRLLRARAGRRVRALTPALYLALRRLAAARGVLVTLAVVSSVAFGAFFYAETLAASLAKTTNEKAYIATGSDVSAQIAEDTPLPRSFPYPITRLQTSNQGASIGSSIGTQADVMTVDPASLQRTLPWSSDWGPSPATFVPQLSAAASTPLPVIATADIPATTKAIWIQGFRFPIRILARVKAFPGMSEGVPLVVTSARALNAASTKVGLFNPLNVATTYIWAKGPPAAVERALRGSSLQPYYIVSVDTYRTNSDFLLAIRVLSYMRTVAIAAGILVLIGLMLYLQARQRSQAIASALARRMGLRRATEILSLSLELGAIVFFSAALGGAIAIAAAEPVGGHLDPLPQYPPSPVFALPTTAIAVVAGALVLVSIVAGALTSWLAGRADMSEALRVA